MKRHVLLGLVAAMFLNGCTTYYAVTDPASGRTYYTTGLDRKTTNVYFHDERSGKMVTLTNYEVQNISESQYKAGLATPAAPAPTVNP